MNEKKGISLPYWLLKLLPMWDHICPKCRKEVKQKTHKCIHCGENYGVPIRVPPRMLKDPNVLEEYVHKHIFPKVSPLHRTYLTQFFTILFADGLESGTILTTDLPPGAWTATLGVPVVVNTPVHSGGFAVNLPVTGVNAYVSVTLGYYAEIYMRFYWQTDTLAAGSDDEILKIGQDGTAQLLLSMSDDLGILKWKLGYRNGGAWNDLLNATIPPAINTWFCVEVHHLIAAAAGVEQLWINGTLCIDLSGLSNDDRGATADVFDLRGFKNGGGGSKNWYFDDVVIADLRIGCMVFPKGTIAIHAKLAGII